MENWTKNEREREKKKIGKIFFYFFYLAVPIKRRFDVRFWMTINEIGKKKYFLSKMVKLSLLNISKQNNQIK